MRSFEPMIVIRRSGEPFLNGFAARGTDLPYSVAPRSAFRPEGRFPRGGLGAFRAAKTILHNFTMINLAAHNAMAESRAKSDEAP